MVRCDWKVDKEKNLLFELPGHIIQILCINKYYVSNTMYNVVCYFIEARFSLTWNLVRYIRQSLSMIL